MSEQDKIPEPYKDLLKRVEQIENQLSKVSGTDPQSKKLGEHEKESRAPEVEEEEEEDELSTEETAPVLVKSDAYLKMAIHSKQYASEFIKKSDWVEVIGLLTGHVINEDTPLEQIQINDAWPVGHGDAVSVEIIETESVSKIMEKLPEGDFIVGWYHSHPSYGNFLSIDDYNTQNRYQTLWSKAIALVIDPTQINNSDYGFGVFRNTKKEPGSKGYTELSYEVDGMSTSAANSILDLIRPAFETDDLRLLDYE